MKLEIKEVVCDWGIYVDGETYPFMIFNSKANAQEIMRIMELDNKHERFDSVKKWRMNVKQWNTKKHAPIISIF
ncbi:hypothetical protein N8C83_15655 (plasmid) [Enterococcus faecium]